MAVIADGRYVISGDGEGRHVKGYELPLRRSLWFIAVAGGPWTAIAFIVSRWWRRRASREGDAADEAGLRYRSALTAGNP